MASWWNSVKSVSGHSEVISIHFSVPKAKEYYQMDGYVTDHIEILQDHSALFKVLAFFEEDLERRCRMHKRRVDMLEPICNGTTEVFCFGLCF